MPLGSLLEQSAAVVGAPEVAQAHERIVAEMPSFRVPPTAVKLFSFFLLTSSLLTCSNMQYPSCWTKQSR